ISEYAYDFVGSNKIVHWDFQLWEPILKRFGRKNNTGAEKFYESTGVLGSGDNSITLHNTSNDAWAQLATLLRFFHMSEECFSRWVYAGEVLKLLDMSWVDLEILHYNSGLERKFHPVDRKSRLLSPWPSPTLSQRGYEQEEHHHQHQREELQGMPCEVEVSHNFI
ncbi:hypothetical protein QBC32DRAFT_319415, partial [Pseudoneurospora amorphoporcata]